MARRPTKKQKDLNEFVLAMVIAVILLMLGEMFLGSLGGSGGYSGDW